MKRTITTLVLAASMMLLAIPAAFATHVDETSHDTAGKGELECRPGAQDNDIIGSWGITDKDHFVQDWIDRRIELRGLDVNDPEDQATIEGWRVDLSKRADATWTFCDKNRDGLACVFWQEFPDGAPYSFAWLALDNRPFGK